LVACIVAALSGCGMLPPKPVKMLSDEALLLVTQRAKVKVAVEDPPGSWQWGEYGWVWIEPGYGIVPNAINYPEWMEPVD